MGIRHSSDANDGDPAIRWSQKCDGGKRFDAIDAAPAGPPPSTPVLSYGDGRESVWREIDALLGDERSAPPYSIPDRIRMLVEDVKTLRAEIEKITREQPEERSQLLARSWIYEQWAPAMRKLFRIFGYCTPSEIPGLAEKLIRENNNASAEIARLEARDRESWEMLKGYADAPGAWHGRVARYLSGDPPAPDPLLVEAREVLRGYLPILSAAGSSYWEGKFAAILAKLNARIGGG